MEENKKEIIEETKIVETKIEDTVGTGLETKEIINEVSEPEPVQTNKISDKLVTYLLKNEDIKEFTDKLTFKIDDKVLSILKLILKKSPEVLDKITDNVRVILKDGIIDKKDIPQFFKLVANLYKTDFKSVVTNLKVDTKEIVLFIKSLIMILIDLDFVKVTNKSEVNEMIDISAELLEFVIPVEEVSTQCCVGFFSRFTKK